MGMGIAKQNWPTEITVGAFLGFKRIYISKMWAIDTAYLFQIFSNLWPRLLSS